MPEAQGVWDRLLLVAVGGALGAVARYQTTAWLARLAYPSTFPYGTLAVNVAGSFLLGLLLGFGAESRLAVPPTLRIALGAGFLGAFTTFSTFSYETLEVLRLGEPRLALVNVAANLTAALAACWLGIVLGGKV